MNTSQRILQNMLRGFAAAVVACACAAHAAGVDDILDGRNALQCYADGDDVRCRAIQTGEDWKVFSRSGRTKEVWVGSINDGGNKLVCEDGRWVVVVNLDGSNHQYVAGPRMTNGHFFRDSDGSDWVVYSGEEESDEQAGTTWKVRIDSLTNEALGSTRTLMLGEQYTCGLGGSGEYAGEVFPNAYLYNLTSSEKSTVLYDTTSWWEPKCSYGSIHPGGRPMLMFSTDSTLHTIAIAQWLEDTNEARRVWRYRHNDGTAFGLWSSTDSSICAVVKDRELFVVSLTVDV
ncbi:MAG: hypothetical protein GF418_08340, partial [Chitinivibrionales bacterium]|nr:hypothetical protein [Chitinivibrionales bacterium]MBD3395622.1 hypothetical protein [Chitinivibrionales bacterium]